MSLTGRMSKYLKASPRKKVMVGVIAALCVAGVLVALLFRTRHPVFPTTPGADAIVFVSNRNGSFDLYVIYPDGTHETRLTYLRSEVGEWWFPDILVPYSDLVTNFRPQPTHDGQGVTFISNFQGEDYRYQINLDGADFHRVDSPLSRIHTAVSSPTGQQIAYLGGDDRLVVSTPDGNSERCLTCGMGGLILSQAWSPDGQTLVFSRFKDKQHNLYRVNVDGTHLLQLTSAPTATLDAFNVEPAWSPDGQQIVFASDRDGAFSEIYVMNADGSNPVRLTSGGAREPSWSPGGEQIAYVASPDGDKTEIYVMNADGSNQRRLTANPAYDNEPIWVRMR